MRARVSWFRCAWAVLIPLAVGVLWLRFNAPPGKLGYEFPTDLIYYYLPMVEQAAQRLGAGELPLWNPHNCCGIPFMATAQVGVFYPGTWLAMLMPVGQAITLLVFSELVLVGLFTAAFLRATEVGHFAATVGGILAVFACALGQTFWPSQVATLVWLPLLMWAVERYVRTGGRVCWIVLWAAMSLQMLAGFPQYVAYTYCLLVPYAVVRSAECATGPDGRVSHAATIKPVLSILAALLLAVGLSAMQLLPARELVANTLREQKLDERAVHYLEDQRDTPVTWSSLLTNAFNPEPKMVAFDYPEGSGYLGIATLAWAWVGIVARWRRPVVKVLVAVILVSVVLSFGYRTCSGVFYRPFAAIPILGSLRTPERLRLLTFSCVIYLAVWGLDWLLTSWDELNQWSGKRKGVAAVGILAWLVGLLVHFTPLGALLAIGSVVTVMLAIATRRQPRVAVLAQLAILGMVVVDLSGATGPYGSYRDLPLKWGQNLSWADHQIMSGAELSETINQAGLDRVAAPYARPEMPLSPVPRGYRLVAYEPLVPRRWSELNRAAGGKELRTMTLIDPFKHRGIYEMASVQTMILPNPTQQFLASHGVKRPTLALTPAVAPGLNSVQADDHRKVPRAYLAGRFDVCTAAAALDRVAQGSFDNQNVVLLEADPGIANGPPDATRTEARITSYAPERIIVAGTADRERMLVLTDTFFPGWTATVNGRDAEILPANYVFRAVRVPAGAFEVVFEYRPASLRTGAMVSLVAALAAIIFACAIVPRFRTQAI